MALDSSAIQLDNMVGDVVLECNGVPLHYTIINTKPDFWPFHILGALTTRTKLTCLHTSSSQIAPNDLSFERELVTLSDPCLLFETFMRLERLFVVDIPSDVFPEKLLGLVASSSGM